MLYHWLFIRAGKRPEVLRLREPGGTKRATSVNIQYNTTTTTTTDTTNNNTNDATSAPAELGGEMHNFSRNRASTKVPLQAQKLHVYGLRKWHVWCLLVNEAQLPRWSSQPLLSCELKSELLRIWKYESLCIC